MKSNTPFYKNKSFLIGLAVLWAALAIYNFGKITGHFIYNITH